MGLHEAAEKPRAFAPCHFRLRLPSILLTSRLALLRSASRFQWDRQMSHTTSTEKTSIIVLERQERDDDCVKNEPEWPEHPDHEPPRVVLKPHNVSAEIARY